MPLATQPRVEALLLRPLTTTEGTYFDTLAEMVDSAIEDELPGISLVASSETVTATVSLDGDIWTPHYPVVAVTSIVAEGVALELPDKIDPYGPVRPPRVWGWMGKGLSAWRYGSVVEITYDFGFDTPPPGLARVAAEVLVANLTGPRGGVRQEQLGDHMVGFGAGVQGGVVRLDESQLKSVRRWRRQITSLPMDRAGA